MGGAFGHKFKSLIEFLGIVTLIITDVDSVTLLPADHDGDDDDDDELEIEVEALEVDAANDVDELLGGDAPAAQAGDADAGARLDHGDHVPARRPRAGQAPVRGVRAGFHRLGVMSRHSP